jgi:hypothetical protein
MPRPSILFGNADMGIRHMQAMLLDVAQAFFDVDARLCLASHQLDRFESRPRSIRGRKVDALVVTRETEYTAFALKMYTCIVTS